MRARNRLKWLMMVLAFSKVGVAELSLDAYLDQVKKNNGTYQASAISIQGQKERLREGQITLYAPQFFAEGNYADDRRPTIAVAFQGDRTTLQKLSLGINQMTSFGLGARLSYNVSNTQIFNASPLLVTTPNFFDSGLGLDLTLPLWRNSFGASNRALLSAAEAGARAGILGETFKAKMVLAEAETRYWRLAVAREIVRVQKESLDRTIKIREYNAKRVANSLADNNELLQSDAAVKGRELELKGAQMEERAARRAFNVGRGIDSDDMTETLALPPIAEVAALQIPERMAKREDVQAAEEGKRASAANFEAQKEKWLPTADIVGSVSLNGRDANSSTAITNSFSTRNPLAAIGFKFAVPLDTGALDVRRGYMKEAQSTEIAFERKMFEQEAEWKDLTQKFTELKERLDLVVALQTAQSLKLEAERKRQKEGQSTTYQVFMFEQEFLGSQLAQIQLVGGLLNLNAQMKTYRGDL